DHKLNKYIAPSTWILDLHTFKPLAKLQGSKLYSAISDHLGTPRELIDNNGQIVWAAYYSPWGEIPDKKGGSVDCPIRFQGQWFDEESGLHYSRYRYYDPDAGRFISTDPAGLRAGLNLYRYGLNPINWIDPFGLDWNYVLVDNTG